MQQLTQKLKNGAMNVIEVTLPMVQAGRVLVRNHYSLVSAGTEGSTVKTARKGFIGKARERPQQVRQVVETLKNQGPVQTYRAVMKKLEAHSPLGYSCVGEVIGLGQDVTEFKLGDTVACGGLTASHAEVVSVPVNLCVKLKPETDLKQAAYNSLGAIALQGVRQADLRLGETCAVIGLGLLGQLTCLLLRAAGVRTVGVDIDAAMVATAAEHCADLALCRDQGGLEAQIEAFTSGLGCDAVIITAAGNSLDPINFAGAIARKCGTVVVLGAVPTGFDREPHFYKKELQVKMSCSYGPGRYDPCYEDKGCDYPAAYVRWTEKRNMQAFQALIADGKIDVAYLTTHTLKLADAPAAYDMMMQRQEPFIGILIAYDTQKPLTAGRVVRLHQTRPAQADRLGIAFVGAGSYAQSHLLPNIPKAADIALKGVLTTSGTSARSVADRFGFEFCASDEADLLTDAAVNTLFVASRHDSHAEWVCKGMQHGKHVFVEKPLCLTATELDEVEAVMQNRPERAPILMVGYNRRFAPLTRALKDAMGHGVPLAMLYRVNAGAIAAGSWIQDPATGGGRIVGEVCHFVDFLTYLCGATPVGVHAVALPDPHHLKDTLNISLTFANGSIGTISYLANGSKALAKERVEVHGGGLSAVLDDFRKLTLFKGGARQEKKLLTQDKGQKNMVRDFIGAARNGGMPPIALQDILNTSLVTLRIIESIRTGRCLPLEGRSPEEQPTSHAAR